MRVYNIPVFVPHKGCPFECSFCNQRRITGAVKDVEPQDVAEITESFLKTIGDTKNNGDTKIEIAFFGGSFTGIPVDEQTRLLAAACEYVKSGRVDGIRLSTRPDYISAEILDNLKKHGVTTIELGVQSMDDNVLIRSGRGHTADDVRKAARLIHEYGFSLGLQMMTGLPDDTGAESIYTAREIIKLRPDMVRIYPTLIIRGTALEDMYSAGVYRPQSVDEAVELCKTLFLMFRENNIEVIRIGLQSTEEICESGSVVAGPVHSAFGELVENAVRYDEILKIIGDSKNCDITIAVNDRDISKTAGNKRRNIIKIKNERNINLKIIGDRNVKSGEVKRVCC